MPPPRRFRDGRPRRRSPVPRTAGARGAAAEAATATLPRPVELSSPPPHPLPALRSRVRQHARRGRGRPAPPRRARPRTGSPDRQAESAWRRRTGTTCTDAAPRRAARGRVMSDLCNQAQGCRPWRSRAGATLLGALRITRGDYACPSAVGIRPRHIIHQSPRSNHERRAGECRAPGSRPSGLRSQLR